ncbi:App1 family protein [Leisingera methylohalidivorans]|uniref:ABC transporter ATPase n=1 Tax=Leisingera methylohalidivorans DSM 14336 TaxID=999552 RepID=V9VUW3_9RHOB|nr:phosphatase domain-containing protein [Leisingera methylohalidivorans]AHD02551.1 ABC transporter ATPase [Leisingera methylohalidivorans DSM 14336]
MLKKALHRIALGAERLLDRVPPRRNRSGADLVIDPHIGYSTAEHVIVRGRVLRGLRGSTARHEQGVLRNVWQMVSLFLTDEVAGVTVAHGRATAVTDDEGYFQLLLPVGRPPGWHDIKVTIANGGTASACPVFVPRPDARFLVISDIDDTVLHTSAYSLLRNLWTTFSGNALTRRIYPDSAALLQSLSENGRNPVFYVSSSPWNMHGFLTQVFSQAGLVRGPMFLRDLGLSETQFISAGHGSHKGSSVDALLKAHPTLPAVLVGDTGQKDASIYRDAVQRHPGRVSAVLLKVPQNGLDADDRHDLKQLRASGVHVFPASSFEGAVQQLNLWLPPP